MGIVIGRLDNAIDHGAFVVYVISKTSAGWGWKIGCICWREKERGVRAGGAGWERELGVSVHDEEQGVGETAREREGMRGERSNGRGITSKLLRINELTQ